LRLHSAQRSKSTVRRTHSFNAGLCAQAEYHFYA
jgi:hypothetical protein